MGASSSRIHPGDIVQSTKIRGTFVVVGDYYLGSMLDREYGKTRRGYIRITNGSRTWTQYYKHLTVIGKLEGIE